jgi:ubiquitin carboxyl-terminal hydrolase 5/13
MPTFHSHGTLRHLPSTHRPFVSVQVDLNIKFEYNAITEGGQELTPVMGPGLVGLNNLGNYCYMSSVLQALWGIPALAQTYAQRADAIMQAAPAEIVLDFPSQFAKVGRALVTGAPAAQFSARVHVNTELALYPPSLRMI